MAIGYFIGLGDKTRCGGKVLDADTSMMMFGFARACEGDRVSCGADGETYSIIGGVPNMRSNGRLVAGTLDSVSSCPCRAKLISSNTSASYQSSNAPAAASQRAATPVPASQPAAPTLTAAQPAHIVFTPAFKSRWGEEPGFYLVPRSMTRETLMAELFDTFSPGASYRWSHPFKDKRDPLQQLAHMANATGGFYPLGRNGMWHGGVCFDAGTAGVLDQDHRCQSRTLLPLAGGHPWA